MRILVPVILALTAWANFIRWYEAQPPSLQEQTDDLCSAHGGVAGVREGYAAQRVYCADGDGFRHATGRWHYIKVRRNHSEA